MKSPTDLHLRIVSTTPRIIVLIALAIACVLYFLDVVVKANTTYFALTPGVPLTQNWNDTSLISANDNWTGVPSIMGYRGDDVAVVTQDIDPQTVLADYSSVPDVNANQSLPNTFATAGVTEFQTADPAVAISANGTSDFPNLEFRVDATGCVSPNSVRVSYNLRDLDGSADNAVQQVALHYRVGSTGNYTNVPAAYVADATTGSSATQVTPINVALPATVLGQPQVHIRVLTTNAAGNDEWIGVDDINVNCIAPTAAGVTLSGRVMDRYGRPISRAMVTVQGGDLQEPKVAFTNTFGYYRFVDLRAGNLYVASVAARRYTFSNGVRPLNLFDSVSDLVFVAD
jgi:hypothetical protein